MSNLVPYMYTNIFFGSVSIRSQKANFKVIRPIEPITTDHNRSQPIDVSPDKVKLARTVGRILFENVSTRDNSRARIMPLRGAVSRHLFRLFW